VPPKNIGLVISDDVSTESDFIINFVNATNLDCDVGYWVEMNIVWEPESPEVVKLAFSPGR